MIALDSNVLVRLLVEEDGEQARKALALLRRAADRGERLYVSDVVVCEVAWVLASVYELEPAQVTAAVRGLVDATELAFRDPAALERALADGEARGGDLADHVILQLALAAGCTAVATFDRALLKQPGFVSP